MKSERHEARIAEICSEVGCWAKAVSVVTTTIPLANNARIVCQEPRQAALHANLPFLPGGTLHNRAAAVQCAVYCHSASALRLRLSLIIQS